MGGNPKETVGIQLDFLLELDEQSKFFHGMEVVYVCNFWQNLAWLNILQVGVVQRVELTMIQTTYTTRVTTLETKDGCPLGPGGNLQKEVDPLTYWTLSDNSFLFLFSY